MSVGYKAVQWSPAKRAYDLALLGGIVSEGAAEAVDLSLLGAPEAFALLPRLHDRDSVHALGECLVRVTGDDHVDQSRR